MKTRFVKMVKTTQSEIASHESRVNEEIQKLHDPGAKIISITHTPFGISPMYLICHIVYENENIVNFSERSEDNHDENAEFAG